MNVVQRASPELQELYQALEVEFNPLTLCKRVHTITSQLQGDEQYIPPLQVSELFLSCYITCHIRSNIPPLSPRLEVAASLARHAIQLQPCGVRHHTRASFIRLGILCLSAFMYVTNLMKISQYFRTSLW